MDNKYNISRKENVFLARKKWDENIYSGMKMENRNVTFPQTQTILNGINVGSVALSDVQAILNMRDAWKYLLGTVGDPVTVPYICELNRLISRNESLEWGVLRTGTVGISGTDYIPPIPITEKAESELDGILKSGKSNTENALDFYRELI